MLQPNQTGLDNSYTKAESISSALASKGCINSNPVFLLGEEDYQTYLNGTTRKLVKDVVHNASASLYVKGQGGDYKSSSSFVMLTDREYRAVLDMKFLDNNTPNNDKKVLWYVGIDSYDSDDLQIRHTMEPIDNTKYGVLTQDLSIGDMSITFSTSQASGDIVFPNSGTGYNRNILGYEANGAEYNYIGLNGRIYQHLAYSRWLLSHSSDGAYDNDSITDNGDGTYTLQLKYAWNAKDLKAGDAVLCSQDGGTYSYWLSDKTVADGKFHLSSSAWKEFKGDDDSFTGGDETLARNGAVKMKAILLPNYRLEENGATISASDLEGWHAAIRLEWRPKA